MADAGRVELGQRSAGNVEQAAEQAEEETFHTTEQCAKWLHVTPPTLLKWGRDGKLPFIQLERKCLWHRPSVKQALLRLQRNNGGAL